jgi:putative ABC transport system permease protein
VGFGQFLPLTGQMSFYSIDVEDQPRAADELPVFASADQVETGYLEAMGIRILEGRAFQSGDGAEGARSVVVSESFANHWWPGASALGRRVRHGFPGEEWYQIVGVAADAHYASLTEAPEEMIYWPATVGAAAQPQPTRGMDIVVKTGTDPLALVPVLRREAQALNPRIPVSNPRTMDSIVSDASSRTSFTMALLGAASGIALVLGLVGIYGVVSYVVSQRTREIGVRIALGATAPAVRGMVVRHGLFLSGVGVLIGLVAAGALSSILAKLLYGVSALDPLTYGSVAVALVTVSVAASWIPAMRAAGVDPARALRSE